MPEGLEAEIWRRAAEPLVGRRIASLWCDERVAPEGLADTLAGSTITAIERAGKVVQVATDGGVLGLHLGMTGRLEVDGVAAIEKLDYASGADRSEWDRLRMTTDPGQGIALRMNDPRRLGRLSLDEAIDVGPDLLTLTAAELAASLVGRRAAIKSVLLDQRSVAGLGNLCADEVLFWASIAPTRRADEVGASCIEALALACRERLPLMLVAGGSTHGVLSPQVRAAVGACPLDGSPLERSTVGGRTAVWCPTHQR